MNTITRHVVSALAPVIGIGLAQGSAAGPIESFWNQPFGGFFEVPGNWNGPVPDETVTAIFDLDAQYPVQFWHGDGASNRLIVRDGLVTFGLTADVQGTAPRFYDAVNPSFILTSVLVGDTAAGEPTLTIRGGVLNSQYTIIGLVPGSLGTIDFLATAQLSPALVNQAHIHVGLQGNGVLNVANSAQVSCTDAVLGSLGGGSGAVSVIGSGAMLDCAGKLTVGKLGQGTLSVSDDGEAQCTSAIIGQQPGAAGEATVTGIGSMLDISGTLDVGLYGTGSISVVGGGAMLSEGFATIGTFGQQLPGQTGGVGDVTVSGPASTWIHDGDLYVGFQGSGTLDVLDGATVTATRGFAGTDVEGVAVATVDGPGSVLALSDELDVHTMLTVSDGALVIADLIHALGGELAGDGTLIGAVVNDGVLAPGHPLGTLAVVGDYGQSGLLSIDLGGTAAQQFDSLEVSQSAQLGGSLIVSLTDGFVPDRGDSFTIVSAGTLLGDFTFVTLPSVGPSLVWQLTQGDSELVLRAIGNPDLNGNGAVGTSDFLALLQAWGPCPPADDCPADLDGDGTVGPADFLLLLSEWG